MSFGIGFSRAGGGSALTASASSFLTAITAGSTIATLSKPFGIFTIYTVIGSTPAEIALSAGKIVRGSTPPTAGETYSIKIRAENARNTAAVEATLTFAAIVGLPSLVQISQAAGSTYYKMFNGTVTKSGGNADQFTLTNGILSLPARPFVAGANVFTTTINQTLDDGTTAAYDVRVTVTDVEGATSQTTAFIDPMTGAGRLDTVNPTQWKLVTKSGMTPEQIASIHDLTYFNGKIAYTADNAISNAQFYYLANTPDLTSGKVTFTTQNPAVDGYTNQIFVLAGDDEGNALWVLFTNRVNGSDSSIDGKDGTFWEIHAMRNWQSYDALTSSFFAGSHDLDHFTNKPTDYTFELDRANNRVSVTASTGTTSSYTLTDPLYTVPTGSFGIMGNMLTTQPNVFINGVSFTNPAGSLNVTDYDRRRGDNLAHFTLDWARLKPTRLEHRWIDNDTDLPITSWMLGDSIVTGNTSGKIAYTATAPRSGPLKVELRYYNDIVTSIKFNEPTDFMLAGMKESLFGMNVRSANYYTPLPPLNNWAKFSDLRGDDHRWIYYPEGGIATGEYIVHTNTGITMNQLQGNATLLSSDPTTGVHHIMINGDAFGSGRALTFDGNVDATMLKVVRVGHESDEISELWIANMEGCGMRVLDMVGTNLVPTVAPLTRNLDDVDQAGIWSNYSSGGKFIPFSVVCRMMAAKHAQDPNFKVLWYPQPADLTDAQVLAEAQYAYAHLPSTVRIGLEFCNEQPWNFNNNMLRLHLGGLSRGYYGDNATFASPNAPLDVSSITDQLIGAGPSGDPTTFPALSANQLVLFNVYGQGTFIWKALKAVPATQPVVEGEFWTRLVQYGAPDAIVARRFRAARHLECINIWKGVFGSSFNDRVAPVLMGQSLNGTAPHEQMAEELSFVTGYQDALAGIGWGWYLYDQTTGPDSYLDETMTPDKLLPYFVADMPNHADRMEGAYASAKALGKEVWLYEGGSHYSHYKYGADDHSVSQAYWDSMTNVWRSAANAKIVFKNMVLSARKHTAGPSAGVVMMYDALAGGSVWSLRDNYTDTTNNRYLGWHEALNTVLP